MNKRKKPRFNVSRREDLPRWRMQADLFNPSLWWVLVDGGWFTVRAPSFEEAEAFVEGLYGPATLPA